MPPYLTKQEFFGLIFTGLKFSFLRFSILFGVIILLTFGCKARRERTNYYYFDHQVASNTLPVYLVGIDKGATIAPKDPFVKVGDRVAIRMLGISAVQENIGSGGGAQAALESYLVDAEGMIAMPLLGRVRVIGLSRREIGKRLETLYANYIVDPMIEVTIIGHSVLVWSDSKGGIYELNKDRTSLIEIITKSGGITALDKRNAVRLIRTNSNGKKEILIFDFTKINLLDQEELWVQDKDIILIEPKKVKVISSSISPYLSLFSLITSVISIGVVFYSIIPKK